MKRALRARRRQQRGQALGLAAVSLIVIALMLMLSFNLAQTLHEKIRLQQHSDAMAFSMATLEARAFNYFAYSNRAEAAAYVAMTSLHAYLSAASLTGAMMQTGQYNFFVIIGELIAECAGSLGTAPACEQIPQAVEIAVQYGEQADNWNQTVTNLDQAFNSSIDGLDKMVNMIHLSQQDVLLQTTAALTQGIQKLTDTNAPQSSSLPMAVGLKNVNEMACAIDGVDVPPCVDGTSSLPQQNRAKVMTSVANATRPDWPANRGGIPFPIWLNPQYLESLMTNIPEGGASIPILYTDTAKLIDSTSTGELTDGQDGKQGKDVGAEDEGILISIFNSAAMALPFSADVISDPNNGSEHNPSSAHNDPHTKFEGVQVQSTCNGISGNCFINFRHNTSASADFNQPHVYAYTTQDMRLNPEGNKGPWEINQSGTVSIGMGGQGTGTLTMVPQSSGVAVSKAMVYYHRLGDWHEHPNMFNPFWRAKLHPFKTAEASEILTLAGNASAAEQALLAPTDD